MSNRNQRLLLYVSGVLTMLTSQSCTHYYYGPNSANVPLLEKKGDARIAAGIAGADETTGFEMQTSYAFSNHFGGMINLYKIGGKSHRSNPGIWGPGEKGEEKGGSLL